MTTNLPATWATIRRLTNCREAIRKSIFHEKQYAAQQAAKEALIDRLVEAHEFPVPEVYIDRQIENQVRMPSCAIWPGKASTRIRSSSTGQKVKENQRDKALRNVKASLLLEKISDKEGIKPTQDEVDREVQRIARQEREAIPVTRARSGKGRRLRPNRGPYTNRKDASFSIRAGPETGLSR